MLTRDEELDYTEYISYLRSQTESDLCDIASHLDGDRFPRRHEALQREMMRRRVLLSPAFTREENWIRYACLWTIAAALLAMVLACTMNAAEALAPQPLPSIGLTTDIAISTGNGQVSGAESINVAVMAQAFWQELQNALRFCVLYISDFGLFLAGLLFCFWQAAMLGVRRLRGARTSSGVAALVLAALCCQPILMATSVASHLPLLVNVDHKPVQGTATRAVSVYVPWVG